MNRIMRFLTFGVMAVACGFGSVYVAFVHFQVGDSDARTDGRMSARSVDGPVQVPRYVINLSSSTKPIELSTAQHPDALAKYQIYRIQVVVNDTIWHQLRLGFFADQASAQRVARSLRKDFPLARVAAASPREWRERANAALVAFAAPELAAPVRAKAVSTPIQADPNTKHAAAAVRVALSSPSIGADPDFSSREESPDNCDAFTAHPWDPHKLTAGVYWNQVPAAKSVLACRTAVRDDPSARNMFQYGRALAKSKEFVEAATWYQKSATQGYVQAQYALGDAYEFGEGVETSYVLAQAWYRKAADQGYSHATARLDRLQHASITNVRQQMAIAGPLVPATR
jgi:hypothetical protein